GQVFLGLTVNCCRCHDHKIDPIPQRDYYKLLAFFHGIRRYANGPDSLRPIPGGQALCVAEEGPRAKDTFVLLRGNPQNHGDKVEPGFPSVLTPLAAPAPTIPPPTSGAKTSGRRRVLADWIADPKNPLTARVLANRVWQYHFGRGLVRSS